MGIMVNPLRSNPEDFFVAPAHNQDAIFIKGSRFYAKFFLVGLLLASSVKSEGTSYKIAPEPMSWARLTAILGNLYRERALYFTTYENGLNFSTRKSKGMFLFLLTTSFTISLSEETTTIKLSGDPDDKLVLNHDDPGNIYKHQTSITENRKFLYTTAHTTRVPSYVKTYRPWMPMISVQIPPFSLLSMLRNTTQRNRKTTSSLPPVLSISKKLFYSHQQSSTAIY
jgi:hypothetical protein